jgi:hypothetical protein
LAITHLPNILLDLLLLLLLLQLAQRCLGHSSQQLP